MASKHCVVLKNKTNASNHIQHCERQCVFHSVYKIGSTTAPPGVLFHMKVPDMNELLEVQTVPIENTDLVVDSAPIVAEPTPRPEKIDASAPPAETHVPSFIPSFKAFRNFLSP